MSNTTIRLFNAEGIHVETITKVLSATLRDALDGECTFEFVILTEMAVGIKTNDIVILNIGGIEYVFNVVRISKTLSNGLRLCSISCEHKSYELNEEAYNLEFFDFIGDPAEGLSLILEGTNLIAGSVEFSGSIALKINQKCSRRAALMQYIALLGGEIEYSGNAINIRTHRGSREFLEAMNGKAVSDMSVTFDSRADTSTYGLTLYKKLDFKTGDNVHIVFLPFGLDVMTRIIAMSYNPFNRREIQIDVGKYLPSVTDQFYRIENSMNDIGNRVESLEKITAKYTAEFGDIVGSGTFYFRTTYEDKPTSFIFPSVGESTMEFLMSGDKYVGATITASDPIAITSVVFYCTLSLIEET